MRLQKGFLDDEEGGRGENQLVARGCPEFILGWHVWGCDKIE
jgi:hypothetical protein